MFNARRYAALSDAFPDSKLRLKNTANPLARIPAGNLSDKNAMVPYQLTMGQWKTAAKIFQDKDTGEFSQEVDGW